MELICIMGPKTEIGLSNGPNRTGFMSLLNDGSRKNLSKFEFLYSKGADEKYPVYVSD
jgi:hypothetical protein